MWCATAPADAKAGTYAINATCGKGNGADPLHRYGDNNHSHQRAAAHDNNATGCHDNDAARDDHNPVARHDNDGHDHHDDRCHHNNIRAAAAVTDEPKTDGGLKLDHSSIQPGDTLSASGTGCEPGHDVTLTADGERVGEAKADGGGSFTAPVQFTKIEPGRHTIMASCGVELTGVVDQALTSSSGDYSSTLIVLVFFVLGGIVFVRFAIRRVSVMAGGGGWWVFAVGVAWAHLWVAWILCGASGRWPPRGNSGAGSACPSRGELRPSSTSTQNPRLGVRCRR
ncbi:hypothetical protein [Kutzneria kofuensis]|uniref:hypothetical protein n=1 Tax=Kutzneria kofuensis TaxID=103725 RepID=UPI0031E61CF9